MTLTTLMTDESDSSDNSTNSDDSDDSENSALIILKILATLTTLSIAWCYFNPLKQTFNTQNLITYKHLWIIFSKKSFMMKFGILEDCAM